jgi:hypothetical protein
MKDNNFPKKQIKPYDGMSITAAVWAEAHEEHRQTERAHNLFLHGNGIITGLEVVANDPPDKHVFISPGIAIDSGGNVIELTEPVAYDFGNTTEGTLYLLLGHGEREVGGVQKESRYLQNEFVIAARSTLPKRASVELGRITISDKDESIRDAEDPNHPALNELDLRYRNPVGPDQKTVVRVALCNLGQDGDNEVAGWDFLSREFERNTSYKLILDQNLPITAALLDYQLVFMTGGGEVQFSEEAVGILDQYLDQGKKLILESQDDTSHQAFQELLEKLNRTLAPISGEGSLLTTPHLFTSPPEGLRGNQVMLDSQVIYTNAGYSLAWAGGTGEVQLSRSDIRTAHEWGQNMLHFCL